MRSPLPSSCIPSPGIMPMSLLQLPLRHLTAPFILSMGPVYRLFAPIHSNLLSVIWNHNSIILLVSRCSNSPLLGGVLLSPQCPSEGKQERVKKGGKGQQQAAAVVEELLHAQHNNIIVHWDLPNACPPPSALPSFFFSPLPLSCVYSISRERDSRRELQDILLQRADFSHLAKPVVQEQSAKQPRKLFAAAASLILSSARHKDKRVKL